MLASAPGVRSVLTMRKALPPIESTPGPGLTLAKDGGLAASGIAHEHLAALVAAQP